MPRIRCHYVDCILLDDGYCGAAAIELDPDMGCTTYKRTDDLEIEDDWEDDDEDENGENAWDELEEDGDELWIDDDDEL